MKLTGITLLLTVLTMAALGCSSSHVVGNALLPEGMEETRLPNIDVSGYIYFNADSPVMLTIDRFGLSDVDASLSDPALRQVELDRATIAIGPSLDSSGGILEFVSEQHAQAALGFLQVDTEDKHGWGKLSSSQIMMANGANTWIESVRTAFETNSLATPREHDFLKWDAVTNLPGNPPSRPVAAGVMKLDESLPEALTDRLGIDLLGIGDAFGFVRVDTLGFGVYADSPIEIPDVFDRQFLEESGYGILLVSKSSYHGVLVSFMLGVVAGRTGMETIDIGKTNARHRMVEGMHLILKNKGSLLYAAIAANRQDAENLILSAISN